MVFDIELTSIRSAQLLLDGLRQRAALCDSAITELITEFDTVHAAPPARLVRAKGRVVAWRIRARTPQEQSLFILAGELGQQFLATLPRTVQASFCRFERRRLTLVAQKKILNYQISTVSNWAQAQRIIRAFSKA